MKKKIICLVLTLATLTLSLASCGSFNFWDEDLSAYVSFDKDKFSAAISDGSIKITDGTFTTDATTRENRVMDSIFSSIGANTDKANKLTVGTPDGHDLFYYSYFITVNVDGVEYALAVDSMAKDKAKEAQLGLNFPTDLAKDILLAFADYEFTDATVYAPITSGTSENGQVAYISYTRTYTTTDAEGVESKVTEKVTNHRVVLSDTDPLLKNFVGKTVSSSNSFTISDNADYNGDYSSAKVEWIENAGVTVKDVAAEK